jgi:hypothetical protein
MPFAMALRSLWLVPIECLIQRLFRGCSEAKIAALTRAMAQDDPGKTIPRRVLLRGIFTPSTLVVGILVCFFNT